MAMRRIVIAEHLLAAHDFDPFRRKRHQYLRLPQR